MTDHTYRIIELAGSSEISHADAIENAIAGHQRRCATCAGSR